MQINAKVIDTGKCLTTIRFTSGPDELVRNFVNGDEEMLEAVIESTQLYFLSRRYRREDERRQKLVEIGPELETERKALVSQIINGANA